MRARLPRMLNGLGVSFPLSTIKIRCLFRLWQTVKAAEIAAVSDGYPQVANVAPVRIRQPAKLAHGLAGAGLGAGSAGLDAGGFSPFSTGLAGLAGAGFGAGSADLSLVSAGLAGGVGVALVGSG